MKRAICGVALAGVLTLAASCAGTQGLFAGGNGMFLKLGPATLGLGDTQQGWMALNSLNWAGGYPQQGYAVGAYPQQAYGANQAYPQQTYDPYGTAQTYPQQTYDPYGTTQTYPQQTYDTTGTYGADQAYGTDQTYPQQAYGASGTAVPPSGAGLASLSTNDPAAAAALAQACAAGQQMGIVTVRQVQPDGTYQDIQLDDVNLACGGPAAGGEAGAELKPGDEVMMTFGDAKVVNKGKLKLR